MSVLLCQSKGQHLCGVFGIGWMGWGGGSANLGLVRLGVVCFHDGTPALQLLEVVLGVGVGDVAQLDAHTTDPILKHGPEKPHDPL